MLFILKQSWGNTVFWCDELTLGFPSGEVIYQKLCNISELLWVSIIRGSNQTFHLLTNLISKIYIQMYIGDIYFYTCRFIYKLFFAVGGFHKTMGYVLYVTFLRCFYKTHFGNEPKRKEIQTFECHAWERAHISSLLLYVTKFY